MIFGTFFMFFFLKIPLFAAHLLKFYTDDMFEHTDDPNTTKNRLLKFVKKYKYHFYGWLVFLFYEIVMVGLYLNHFGHPVRYLINYLINIGLFYFHAEFTMRIGLLRRRISIIVLPLLFLVEIGSYTLLIFAAHWLLLQYTSVLGSTSVAFNYQFCISTIFRGCYFIVFSTGYYFLKNYLTERKKSDNLEKDQLKNLIQIARTEGAYLRAQINPHFLFNTLDFIYHNSRPTAPTAAEAISSLSEIMRYAVEVNPDENETLVKREVAQIENLINLHQLRADHSLSIHFYYDEDVLELSIISLLMITVVENMFKHGDLRNPKDPAKISVTLEDNELVINTSNRISQTRPSGGAHSGLNNIIKRMQYAYGNDATIKINTDNQERYTLEIRIKQKPVQYPATVRNLSGQL